jgi:hypothetical protein
MWLKNYKLNYTQRVKYYITLSFRRRKPERQRIGEANHISCSLLLLSVCCSLLLLTVIAPDSCSRNVICFACSLSLGSAIVNPQSKIP